MVQMLLHNPNREKKKPKDSPTSKCTAQAKLLLILMGLDRHIDYLLDEITMFFTIIRSKNVEGRWLFSFNNNSFRELSV